VARTGGDEFAIILDGPTSRPEAKHVGRSLLDLLNEPMEIENKTVTVGASLGIAIFPEDAADFESLCIKADLRMYDNKRGVETDSPIRPISTSHHPHIVHHESETARF
jgi:diguanylate cyclase (GGDEF)-like protein